MPGEALSFPGVAEPVGLHCPHTPGVFPDQIVIWCNPQLTPIPAYGNLIFGINGNLVTLHNCQVDKANYRMSTNGHVIGLVLQDRRWAWKYATITGVYNVRREDGTIANEKNPRELATLLLDAMGEAGYDVSLLPTSGRPEVYWDAASAPLELDRLCAIYGCEPDLDIQTNKAVIRLMNFGPTVPILGDEQSLGVTIDPQQLPQQLRLICGDTVVECLLQMEAVGLDTDGLWKPIDDLSYAPGGGWETEADWIQFNGIADQTERALAVATVGRCFRIKAFPVDSATVPVLDYAISKAEQLLPLKAGLLAEISDTEFPTGVIAYAKHYVEGNPSVAENSDDLTIIRQSFRMDRQSGVITFRNPVLKIESDQWTPADVYLQAAFTIKDSSLLLRKREDRTFPLGGPFGEVILREPGLFRRIRVQYNLAADPPVQTGYTDNLTDLQADADAILAQAALQFTTSVSGVIVYRGTQLIGTNGIIRQVVWTISTENGWKTVVHLANDGHPHAQRLSDRRLWRQSKTALGPETWDRIRRILQDQGSLG